MQVPLEILFLCGNRFKPKIIYLLFADGWQTESHTRRSERDKTGQSDLTQRLEKLEEAPTSKDSNDYQDIDDPESGYEDEYETDDEMITSLMLALKFI